MVMGLLVLWTSMVYNCNIIYKILEKGLASVRWPRPEEGNESENSDLRYRDGGEEGGSEGLQARHYTVGERPLRLFPGWICPSTGCSRS